MKYSIFIQNEIASAFNQSFTCLGCLHTVTPETAYFEIER